MFSIKPTIEFKLKSERVYLDLSDELLCGRLDGSFLIDGTLNGRCPSHGLIQEFGVKAVRVLPAMHHNIPVTCTWNNQEFHQNSTCPLFHSGMNYSLYGYLYIPEYSLWTGPVCATVL